MSERTVCAAIVTYNRKCLLERCLKNILSQDYSVSRIIIVDNHSSDGSKEYIFQRLFQRICQLKIYFSWIRLSENLGGAGGFNKAVEIFMTEGDEDFLWLMDDDGFPEKHTLAELVSHADDDVFIGPIVLSDADKTTFSFPLRLPNSLKVIESLHDIPSNTVLIDKVVLPFNGTLISRKVISKIGLPDKSYFIWGDEIDYTERARNIGAKIFTVAAALYFHPKTQKIGVPMCFGLLRYNDPDSYLKLYCYCRNNFVNKRKYRGVIVAFLFVAKTLWYYSLTCPSFHKLKICLRAFLDGLIGDFSRHKKYL
ncbi:glycosyltransferase family 2 protein [uncultured Parasutterella sp.]|uniref:glycosyltransferase family 2 protein n=1 Tax=uncultured Parasutterella sp. TaxID=1263098 RepID=UPI00272AB8E9|nr:glycosyltransferase family 2 protein [uncultured Parasutterella sp.]